MRRLAVAVLVLGFVSTATAHAEYSPAEAESQALRYTGAQPSSISVDRVTKALDQLSAPTTFDRVVMRGHFISEHAPDGLPAPEGTLQEVLVDPQSGQVREVFLGNENTSAANENASAARVANRVAKAHAHSAAWGSEQCSTANNKHCYAIAEWWMEGSERVRGIWSEQNTSYMDIPEWLSGAFADNESWLAFHPSNYWLEMGQEGGEGYNCCSLRWFYAWKNADGYRQVIESEPGGGWDYYFIIASGFNGAWCFKIGVNGESTPACEGGFPSYSNLLQNGAEIASETEPANAASTVTSYLTANESGWRTWDKATNEANNRMCISQYAPENYPGNVNVGTC